MSINFEYKVREKLARIFSYTKLFETKTGIKIINAHMRNDDLQHSDVFLLNGEDIYLGFDALNDDYTLCGKKIIESPHFELMKLLDKGEKIEESEYCIRYKIGALDGRYPVIVNDKEIQRFQDYFVKRKNEIKSNMYSPVQVYKIGDRYYLADGKHRAALSCLLNGKTKCIEISNDFLKDSTRMWIYEKMKKKQSCYRKNIELFNTMLTAIQKEEIIN